MHFGMMCIKQDYDVIGALYDMRSVYEGWSQLLDMRKAREKLPLFSTLRTPCIETWSSALRGDTP